MNRAVDHEGKKAGIRLNIEHTPRKTSSVSDKNKCAAGIIPEDKERRSRRFRL